MAVLKDSFGNEIREIDTLGGETLTDTRTTSQNLATLNAEVLMDCANINSVALDVRGTFTATLLIEGTIDGTNYFSLPFYIPTSEIWVTTLTTAGVWICDIPSGLKRIRVRVSSYTVGTAIVSLRGSQGDNTIYVKPIPTTFSVTATGSASATVTNTLPSGGVGLFHYITRIRISKYVSIALIPSTSPSIVTTTNIATTPSFDFKTLGSQGDSEVLDIDFTANPLKSTTAATNTTFVTPVLTGAIWKITVFYYVAA